jgi:hypothetical protein
VVSQAKVTWGRSGRADTCTAGSSKATPERRTIGASAVWSPSWRCDTSRPAHAKGSAMSRDQLVGHALGVIEGGTT